MIEKADITIGIMGLIILVMLIACPYGAYKYGRFAERRLLTEALKQTIGQDYGLGYDDGYLKGFIDGEIKGYKDGKAAGRMEILAEEDENGRY